MTIGKILLTISLMIGSILVGNASTIENSAMEIKLKAAYLYNFLRFVEWPSDSKNINVCLYGSPENYQAVFSSIPQYTQTGSEFIVKTIKLGNALGNLENCRIVFVTALAKSDTLSVLAYLNDKHSLTIGEFDSFIENGGMINFVRVEDKLRFEINNSAAERAGLKISSKVLRIATRIHGDSNDE